MRDVIKEYTDSVNVFWVHQTIDILIEIGDSPLLSPLRCIDDKEVLEIIQEHTSEPLLDAHVSIRTNVINSIAGLDWRRRATETAEKMRKFQEGQRAYEEYQAEEIQRREDTALAQQIRQIRNAGGALWLSLK